MQQVHVRINDAATGKPTPCRVRFTDEQGTYYAPFGRLTEFATGYGVDVGGNVIADGKKYAYIDGSCEIALPPGEITVEVHKGPEYTPLLEKVQLQAGKLSLRFTITRWINMREQGWYSGDSRCHFLTPHGALLEGMAEDLAVVNLLAMECQIPQTDEADEKVVTNPWAIPNILAFSGQQPALEVPGHMVVVNTLNWHPWLGRLALLNCHRVVYPLRIGPPGFDDWTLSDWCDQCHRKGGLVVWTEAHRDLVEALADAILGKVDAIEIDSHNWDIFESSYISATLEDSCGVYLPSVGSSGKASNFQLLGDVRTYVQMRPGEQLSYQAWINAIKCGRTFVTRGPLLTLEANQQGPGSTLDIPDATTKIHLRAEARCNAPLRWLRIYYPGGEVSAKASGSPATAYIDKVVDVSKSGCIYARCSASDGMDAYDAEAFTSPIQVRVNGRQTPANNLSIENERHFLTRTLHQLDSHGRFANSAQRDRLRKVFEDAIQVLNERAAQ